MPHVTLLLAVLAVCGTTIYMARLASGALVARWTEERGLEERRVKVLEQEFANRVKEAANRPESVVLPDDLVGRIRMWDDEMAQDNEKQLIMGLYAELKDWDKVRRRLEPLTPMMQTEPAAPRDGLYS